MDLALNNLQKLICHKTQPTNQQPLSLSKFIKVLQIHLVKRRLQDI